MRKPARVASSARTLEATGRCPVCRITVEPPKVFCGSSVCTHEYKIRSDAGYAREQVFLRDHGVCQSCGLDTEKLKSLLYRVRDQKGEAAYLELLAFYRKKTGYHFSIDKHLWEMDHRIPVAQGGGSCDTTNLTTLCVPCHRLKTRRERRRKRKGKLRWKPR